MSKRLFCPSCGSGDVAPPLTVANRDAMIAAILNHEHPDRPRDPLEDLVVFRCNICTCEDVIGAFVAAGDAVSSDAPLPR